MPKRHPGHPDVNLRPRSWFERVTLWGSANNEMRHIAASKLDDGFTFGLGLSDQDRRLLDAANRGRLINLSLALDKGANVDARDSEGRSALCIAARRGHLSCMKRLLDHGAQVDLADVDGFTPIFYATLYGYLEEFKLLLSQGADIDRTVITQGKTITLIDAASPIIRQQVEVEVQRHRLSRVIQNDHVLDEPPGLGL